MRTMKSSLLLALTFAAGACAQVEAEVPEARVTQKSVVFQGMPGASLVGDVSTTFSFTISTEDLSWAKDLNSEVYAYEVELRGVGDMQDLSFIRFARILMSDADSAQEPVEVVNYQRPDGMQPTNTLIVKTTYPIDVTQVWASKKILITMQLAGVFPETSWSADVTFHLGGRMSYSL